MPDFYEKIIGMQGSVEQLVRKVPGFKGYFEREDRRMADRLLREKLVVVFGGQLSELSRLQKQLIDAGGMEYMERLRAIDSRLRTFIDKIQSASSGYAGLLDAVKVDEVALVRVYAFDNALFAYQDQLATGLRRLGETIESDRVSDVLAELEMLVSELMDTFNRRGEAMRGMEDSAK